jgi:hypothetical protein
VNKTDDSNSPAEPLSSRQMDASKFVVAANRGVLDIVVQQSSITHKRSTVCSTGPRDRSTKSVGGTPNSLGLSL